ncbi:restriction endonuclease subunit S, partial [Prevotella nigrescens]|uniref:restriction endonuclease subunit S n=1 Tax=Prevotella nigrescens TaxID=28133 RepID=UPI00288AE24D
MTMVENKDKKVLNVPNLRFKEFEGEWEKKRLGDFTERVKRKNKHNLSKLPLTISAKYGLVDQITFFNKIVASTDMSNYYLLKKGEFAYNKSYSNDYPWGAIKRLDNYEQGVLSALYICFATQDNVESDFILQYFESPKWHRSVSEIAVEGARNHGLLNISVQDFFQTYHYVPKEKKEQTKIATLLHLLDERISTQNKIIEDLKKLKCAIIENVLNNCHDNKMRLGDVGIYIRGLTYSSNDVVEQKGTIVMRSNNIVSGGLLDYCNNVVRVNKQILQEQQLQNGDIVICMANGSSALVGKTSFYDGKCLSPITVGAFCGIYRSKMPITKWLFQTNRYHRYIWNSLQGGNGAIANLNGEDILRMSFPTPDKSTIGHCIKL